MSINPWMWAVGLILPLCAALLAGRAAKIEGSDRDFWTVVAACNGGMVMDWATGCWTGHIVWPWALSGELQIFAWAAAVIFGVAAAVISLASERGSREDKAFSARELERRVGESRARELQLSERRWWAMWAAIRILVATFLMLGIVYLHRVNEARGWSWTQASAGLVALVLAAGVVLAVFAAIDTGGLLLAFVVALGFILFTQRDRFGELSIRVLGGGGVLVVASFVSFVAMAVLGTRALIVAEHLPYRIVPRMKESVTGLFWMVWNPLQDRLFMETDWDEYYRKQQAWPRSYVDLDDCRRYRPGSVPMAALLLGALVAVLGFAVFRYRSDMSWAFTELSAGFSPFFLNMLVGGVFLSVVAAVRFPSGLWDCAKDAVLSIGLLTLGVSALMHADKFTEWRGITVNACFVLLVLLVLLMFGVRRLAGHLSEETKRPAAIGTLLSVSVNVLAVIALRRLPAELASTWVLVELFSRGLASYWVIRGALKVYPPEPVNPRDFD